MKKIIAVDGNSIVNRAFYGVRPLSNKEGFPTNALFGTVGILEKNMSAVAPDAAVIAFDLKAPTFRHKMFEAYKAGRRPTPPDLLTQMPEAKKLARALGFTPVEIEGFEADDILGTVAAMAEASEDTEAYILTGDRDALQLISPRVHVLLVTNTETIDYTPQKFFEKYGVTPAQFVDVKALMGDSSDNIPGVPGIGEKTALKLIADYGSLDGVYEQLPTATHTPSVRRKLEEGRESAYLSRALATICREAPIDGALADFAYEGPDRAALLQIFTRFEFNAFIKRFGLLEAAPTADGRDEAGVCTLTSLDALPLRVALDVIDGTVYLSDGEALLQTVDKDLLTALFAREGGEIVCHDAKSVYHALEKMSITWRGCAFDTMLAAYVLNPAENGFDLVRLSLHHLGVTIPAAPAHVKCILPLADVLAGRVAEVEGEKLLSEIEMPLCRVLTDMELVGFAVDGAGLAAYGEALGETAAALSERIYYMAGGEFNINSPKQLGEVLFERLALPHGKKTKTGYSTNAEVLEGLRHAHPIVDDILDYRQVTKLRSTYTEGLGAQIAQDGRIHTTFKQTGTATGRLSSAEPNLQNIPIRTELGKELRRLFVAKNDNYLLIDADYSQIELRLLAAMADDKAMIEAFAAGEDIHAATAARVFHVPPTMVTPELRKRAKAVNFGILYGMGAHSLAGDLHITMREAREYIESYFAAYEGIDAYLKGVIASAYEQGFVTTLFGRRRYIPELKMQNKNMQHFGERVAMNSPIQGTAADIIKLAMIRVADRLAACGLDARLVLQVHDELIVEAHRDCLDEAREILITEMENAARLSVALKVGVLVGENWYESH